MRGNKAVVGVFNFIDDAIKAIHAAQKDNLEYRVYSPVPHHEIEHATSHGRSAVRFFTSFGGLCGITFGFALAILCSLDFPLRVSAKDIVSVPAFVVIGYECTILFGALCTLLALLHFCRIPDILRKVGYDPRFSENKFGVVVGCESGDVDKVSTMMTQSGAEDVDVRDAL